MNLIICYTPLQVLIAEKIIERFPNEHFYGVMIYTVENKKFRYYAARLERKCNSFLSMYQSTNRLDLLNGIFYLKRKFNNRLFDKVFIASINEIYIQFILSVIGFNHLNTFDDGTANIVSSSFFYTPESKTIIRSLVNTLLGNQYSVEKIKVISEIHYTIYKGLPNINCNTEFIRLFDHNHQDVDLDDCVNILLGQPIYLDEQENIKLAERVVRNFNIHYYLPHPRETYLVKNVEYIDTPLIFEDYLAQEYSNRSCCIYTYFSSAVLNISSKQIEIVSLRVDTKEPAFIECYDLLDKLGVNIIDIRE